MISSSNVHEGRLVQLVALLLVAREKLLAPAIDNSVDGSFIGQCILKELALLLDQEVKLMGTAHNEELNRCRQMKDAIRSMGLMLNVFDKAGGPIDRFRYFIALGVCISSTLFWYHYFFLFILNLSKLSFSFRMIYHHTSLYEM